MNLELDLIRKEIQILKQEVSLLKEYISAKDTRKYFKITFSYTDDTEFKAEPFILDFSSKLSLEHASLTALSKEDTTYYTSLIPDLKVYHNDITLFIITKEPILPQFFENSLKCFPGKSSYLSYTNIEDFYKETSKYNLQSYQVYNNVSL
jgi:hypothetical protein